MGVHLWTWNTELLANDVVIWRNKQNKCKVLEDLECSAQFLWTDFTMLLGAFQEMVTMSCHCTEKRAGTLLKTFLLCFTDTIISYRFERKLCSISTETYEFYDEVTNATNNFPTTLKQARVTALLKNPPLHPVSEYR